MKTNMKIIGITGGIGVGKTAVLNVLANEYDAYIVEADALAHKLMEPGENVYEAVVAEFGMGILADDGSGAIDRAKLGSIVFSDETKLQKLNSISHPLVKESILGQIEEQRSRGRELFVIEAALLIQDGYKDICDYMVNVTADKETRIARLMSGRNIPREKAEAVMANQPPESFYSENSHYDLDNSQELELTKNNIKAIMEKMD